MMDDVAEVFGAEAGSGRAPARMEALAGSVYESLFSGEGILVLQRKAAGVFRVVGVPPDWVEELRPGRFREGTEVEVCREFVFLEQFLEEAEERWRSAVPAPLTSDVWSQDLDSGREQPFTATARLVGREGFLLIRALGVDFEERRRVLQKARELALSHERFLKEINKKEALLHCLVHDVAGPATTVINCFDLLDSEPGLSNNGRNLVSLGISEVMRQQVLLRGTLEIFAAELNALEAFSSDAATAPDVQQCFQSVKKQLAAGFAAKGVTLELVSMRGRTAPVKVVGNPEKLERILYNLLENALRHTPMGSTVGVHLEDEGSAIRIAVDDQGAGVEPGMEEKLFGRFSQGRTLSGKAGLGLFFCQMMVGRWGGEIGCHSLEAGGSRFWFRLPKPRDVQVEVGPMGDQRSASPGRSPSL